MHHVLLQPPEPPLSSKTPGCWAKLCGCLPTHRSMYVGIYLSICLYFHFPAWLAADRPSPSLILCRDYSFAILVLIMRWLGPSCPACPNVATVVPRPHRTELTKHGWVCIPWFGVSSSHCLPALFAHAPPVPSLSFGINPFPVSPQCVSIFCQPAEHSSAQLSQWCVL